MSKIKLAFIIPSLLKVGPNIFAKILCEGILRFYPEIEVTVFFCKKKGDIRFPCRTRHVSSLLLSNRGEYDGCLSTMLMADVFLGVIFRHIEKSRRISILHNIVEEDVRFLYFNNPLRISFYIWIWRIALMGMGRLIVSSPFMRQYYQGFIGRSIDVAVIPYGIQENNCFLYDSIKIKSEFFNIVACGDLINRKNFSLLIRALPKIPCCRLTIIGDGPQKEFLVAAAANIGVSERVSFLGRVENISAELVLADCYVMSSFSEGFGLAMLEAIALGIPTICSDLRIYDGILPKEIFPRFNPESVDDFVSAIAMVRVDPKKYSNGAKMTYINTFRLENMVSSYVSLFADRSDNLKRGLF